MSKIILNKGISAIGRHVTTKVKAQPIEHHFDDRETARIPAQAIAKMVAERIKGITMRAADSTLEKRRKKGQSSTTVFKVTGTLANGIGMAEPTPGRFQTVAPPGRLSPDAPWITRRLLEVIGLNADTIMQVPEVKKAVEETLKRMIRKGR